MPDKTPETVEEMRANAARAAWDRHYRPDGFEVASKAQLRAGKPATPAGWGPVEAREAVRDEGMSEVAAVDDALAAISQPKTLERFDPRYYRNLDTWESLIPEVPMHELDALQRMMARGVVKVDPDLERRIQEFEALRKGGEELDYRRYLAEDKAKRAVSGHNRQTGRTEPLSELQERATLAEAGGDPLKSQMPTE